MLVLTSLPPPRIEAHGPFEVRCASGAACSLPPSLCASILADWSPASSMALTAFHRILFSRRWNWHTHARTHGGARAQNQAHTPALTTSRARPWRWVDCASLSLCLPHPLLLRRVPLGHAHRHAQVVGALLHLRSHARTPHVRYNRQPAFPSTSMHVLGSTAVARLLRFTGPVPGLTSPTLSEDQLQ